MCDLQIYGCGEWTNSTRDDDQALTQDEAQRLSDAVGGFKLAGATAAPAAATRRIARSEQAGELESLDA